MLIIGSMSATVFALQAKAAASRAHITYYSDATHACVIGEKNIDCGGKPQVWGNSSNHYSRSTETCAAG